MTMHSKQIIKHNCVFNHKDKTVIISKRYNLCTGDHVEDQDGRIGHLVWSVTSGKYLIIWNNDNSLSDVVTE